MEDNEISSQQKNEKNKNGFFKNMFSVFSSSPNTKKENKPIPIANDKTMWVPDEKAQTCYNCQKQFSAIFLRKHHCRICGNVFCKDCSSKTVEGKYWGAKKEIKVCDYCFEMYKKLDETLVETTIDNPNNCIEDIDSIDDNMKNLKRETKLSEYCKKAKKDTEEYYKFLQMEKKQEEHVKHNLESFYDQLIRQIIEIILKNDHLYEKWFDKVYDLTKKTISQINPSFRDLKDTLNINDYVKIKTIPYKDQTLCKVVDGFAFQKNVCSKKMNTNIDNPKILLLDCGLDYNRNADNITSFENLMSQEPAYFNIIMKKIELIEPTVILVNKNVSRKIQETLSISNKTSLVMNVKSSSLKKIARCTKTYVLPSTDLIDKQTILGTCKKFRIDKIKIFNNKNDILKTNEYNLMVFEGCDYLLSCTIILSGPDESELKALKKIMRTILLTARDLYLQKFLIYFSFMAVPNIHEINHEFLARQSVTSSRNSSTNSLLSVSNNNHSLFNNLHNTNTNNLINNLRRNNTLVNNALSCFSKFEVENLPYIKDFFYGFDTSILYEKQKIFSVVKLTIAQGIAQQALNNVDKISNFPLEKFQPGTFNNISGELGEHDVLKLVNSICEEPQDIELIFYSGNEYYDKPLGKLIIDLCVESEQKCDTCKKMKSSHIYYMYKKTGRIKIQTIQNQDEYMEKIMELINRESYDFSKYNSYSKGENKKDNVLVNYNIDIFSYGVCKICQKAVTPLVKLPREMFNFSIAKFFKFMLFNHDIHNRNGSKVEFNLSKFSLASNECNHHVNKDISKIFVTKMGTIKFSYENSPIYLIESSPMFERSEPKYFNSVLEVYLNNARERSMEILEYLKINFKYYLEEMNDLPSKITSEDQKIINVLKDNIEKITKILQRYLNMTGEISVFVENLFIVCRFDDYVKAIVYIKKVYFRIVQVKIIFNYIRKTIRKLKKTINFIHKMKILVQQFDKESTTTSYQSTSIISADDPYNNATFINIDSKETYKLMLKEISFFDEYHNKYSSDITDDDISSIIAYTLTSDKYREYICSSNKFKLIDIKCDRKSKPFIDIESLKDKHNVNEINQKAFENQLKMVNENMENENNKYTYNFFTTQDEEVYDTSLLFDQNKTICHYQNLEDHKINQQLETELLSDEKTHFNLTTSNLSILAYLTMWNLSIDFSNSKSPSRKEQGLKTNLIKAQSNDINLESSDSVILNNDDKLTLPGDNIKSTIDELENMRSELLSLTETNKPITDNKTKDKHKKIEYLEETYITPLECEIIVYYPRQFEALRITYCATYDEFILSIAKSNVWSNVSGGKSKADFYKSHDNKFILKCVNKHEFKMFIETGFQYFHHNAKFLFHKMPSALAKILGAYKIKLKNVKSSKMENFYVILMENLFYGKDEIGKNKGIKAYDLKGSRSNRYIPKKDQKPNQVLPDTNFKEDFNGEPIALERNMAELLKAAIHNDSLILSKMNVVDYSLLLVIDENCGIDTNMNNLVNIPYFNMKSIRVGIIDYVRKYTWDKQLEHVGKIIINRLQVPTIVNPVNYKERFKEAIDDFFIGL